MSAVGLMLLEDPKARARAEARLRSGQTKRSYFGRSSKASNSSGGSKRVPDLPPTIPDEDAASDPPIIRPSTSLSQTISFPHRKKAESTSDKGSSRNSIFGRKNSVGASSVHSGSSGRVSQLSTAVSSYSREPVHEEEQYYQTRKPTALPPIQQQQSNNAFKSHLHPLNAVDEKTPNRLWATSRPKKSKDQPNEVQGRDLVTEQRKQYGDLVSTAPRPRSPPNSGPPRLPAAARVSIFDDTFFDKVKDDPFAAEKEVHTLPNSRQMPQEAKKYSTMVARNSLMFPEEPILQTPGILSDTPVSKSSGGSTPTYFPKLAEPNLKSIEPIVVGLKDANAKARGFERRDHVAEPVQPSLPVPSPKPTAKSSESSLVSMGRTSEPKANLSVPPESTLIKDSRSSSPSGSATRSPALSFCNNVRESTVFADSKWEDDIDFVYEQEAEATCDFDWDETSRNSFQSDGGVRLSGLWGAQNLATFRDVHDESWVLNGNTYDDEISTTNATNAEHSEPPRSAGNPRISTVGHRGFAAARTSQGENPIKGGDLHGSPFPTYSPQPQADALSTVSSEHSDSGNETPRSCSSPALEFPTDGSDELDFPMPPNSSTSMEFPMPPNGDRTSADNLSMTDSWRSGSKHRKSSSYGSVDGFARASTAPSTAPSSVPSFRDTGRWSTTSASSVPSLPTLNPNRLKRTSSITKPVASPPLETLMQRPEEEEEEKQLGADRGRFAPQTSLLDADSDNFVIRRPRTSGDRRLLQAAGRAVQQYRPTTPNLTSRGLRAPEPVGNGGNNSTGRLGWI